MKHTIGFTQISVSWKLTVTLYYDILMLDITKKIGFYNDMMVYYYYFEGGVTEYGRREVGQKKSHREVGGSGILDQDERGLDFASQFRDVGGFFWKRFSPKQSIKLTQTQSSNTKCKEGQIRLKISHSNSSWPGIPWNVCIGPQKLLSQTFNTVPAYFCLPSLKGAVPVSMALYQQRL